jgi:WD40 repeat protein/energy-coupling factor transporter ATP-binding protein EcfA2
MSAKGHRSVFLDFDPADGIPAGRNWEQEIYQQLKSSRAVIILCSEESMASKWVFAEITHARALGKYIVPLKIEDCTIDRLISDRQVVDMTGDREDAYRRLRTGLLRAGIDPDDAFDWDGVRPPFPGLLSFHEEDAAVFFGRNDEITEGLSLVNRVRRQDAGEFAMVLGASGSGKSSLVRAGLVPRLRRDPERWLVIGPFRPRDEPTQELSGAFAQRFNEVGDMRNWRSVRVALDGADIETADPDANPLVDIARDLLIRTNRPDARVLLVVDQFEELLGYGPEHASTHMLTMLRQAADHKGSPIVVLGTMRSDFLGIFQNSAPLLGARYQSLSVGPLSADDIMQVVEQPAAIAGLGLETGLAALLVADTEAADALPLLAFTLRELYEKYGERGTLSVSQYRDGLGGLNGAVANVADDLLASERLDAGQLDLLRRGFLTMVRLTDDERWARRVVPWDELPESVRPILDRFVDARLLVSTRGADGNTVEVAHEALFRSWGVLAEWLDMNRTSLRLRADINRASASWLEEGKSDEDVWRGARLDHVVELRDTGDLPLGTTDLEFIQASQSVLQAEAEKEEKRRLRRLQLAGAIAIGASALALVAVFFFFRANDQATIAEEQTAVATAEATRADQTAVVALSRQAEALIATDPALAVGVAAEAMARSRNADTERVVVKANAALQSSRLVQNVRGHTDWLSGVAFSNDASSLATSSFDGTARIWDSATGDESVTLTGHDGAVLSVAFNHDGTRAATGSDDQTAKIWDAATGDLLVTLPGHEGAVLGVAFSPDGTRIATAGEDQTVGIWDAETGQELFTFRDHLGAVWGVAFNDDGTRVASASEDETAMVWDTETGGNVVTLIGHDGAVNGVDFSPDGSVVVTAGADATARTWDSETGERYLFLDDHDSPVTAVSFNHDGTRIATASEDELVKIWDGNTGEDLFVLAGHTLAVWDVEFSHDGTKIATASSDETAKVWSSVTGQEQRVVGGHAGSIRDAVFNHDSTMFATAGEDAATNVWHTTGGKLFGSVTGHNEGLLGLAISHDGTSFATASEDRTAKVWSTESGEELLEVSGHTGPVTAVAFDHSGTTIATSSEDETVKIWDTTTGEELLTLTGHSGIVQDVTFGADDATVVTVGDDGTVRVWDTKIGEMRLGFDAHPVSILGVAVSSDGTSLATASADGTARLWNAVTGEELLRLSGHVGLVLDVAFNDDGTRIATSSEDGTVKVWEADTGAELFALTGHADWVRGVSFSHDGTRILTASDDGTARVWLITTPDSCALMENLVTASELTDAIGGFEPIACTNLRP